MIARLFRKSALQIDRSVYLDGGKPEKSHFSTGNNCLRTLRNKVSTSVSPVTFLGQCNVNAGTQVDIRQAMYQKAK